MRSVACVFLSLITISALNGCDNNDVPVSNNAIAPAGSADASQKINTASEQLQLGTQAKPDAQIKPINGLIEPKNPILNKPVVESAQPVQF